MLLKYSAYKLLLVKINIMIQNLVTYLAIGTVLMFIADLVSMTLIKEAGVTFNNKERIVGILLWPILVLGVILGRFKQH
jgi:hypothetical protein